jgi:serine/threonine protein kinase
MSKASGRPLSEYDWMELSARVPGYPVYFELLPLTDQDREKIMTQLGRMMSSLSGTHFHNIGSVFDDGEGNYSIGECLSPSMIWQSRDQLEGLDRGPFHDESQYFRALISTFICHVKELRLAPHSFFAPIPDPLEYPNWTSYRAAIKMWNSFTSIDDGIEGDRNRLFYCIAGHILYEMMPHIITTSRNFVLSHPDLHTGNIFVDENLNITCIIDWGSASSGPLAELLATPGMNGSVSPPPESLIAAFRSGFEQGGQVIRSDEWKRSEKIWRFSRLIRLLSTQDYTLFKVLYELVYESGSEDIARLMRDESTQKRGMALLAELQQTMEEEEQEEDEQEAGFDENQSSELSSELLITRKLTVMAEINPNFVADKRLWRWIQDSLRRENAE